MSLKTPKIRKSWIIKPLTRVKESRKIYNRGKSKEEQREQGREYSL